MAASDRRGAAASRPGPSSAAPSAPRQTRQSIKRAQQDRLLERLIDTFHDQPLADRTALKKNLNGHVWSPADSWEVDRHIDGLSRRHAIDLSYELSTALRRTFRQLKLSAKQSVDLTQKARQLRLLRQREDQRLLENSSGSRPSAVSRGKRRDDSDDPLLDDPSITPDNVADVVQLLISLSRPANVTTSTYAHLLLDPDRPRKTTYLDPKQKQAVERAEWSRILLEEPLDGDEWRSGSSDTSHLSDWSESSRGQGTRASISDDDDDRYGGVESLGGHRPLDAARAGWAGAAHGSQSSTGDEAGPDWQLMHDHRARALDEVGLHRDQVMVAAARSIEELPDILLVREAVLAMQGYGGLIFSLASPSEMRIRPSLLQASSNGETTKVRQLRTLATAASTLLQLQTFSGTYASGTTAGPPSTDDRRISISLQAFADQVARILERARAFFAVYDSDLAAGLTGNTSSLQVHSRDATLTALLADVDRVTYTLRCLAELLSDLGLLDRLDQGHGIDSDCALLNGLQALLSFDLAGGGDGQSRSVALRRDLSQCFVAMAQPWWRQVCQHIREGVSFGLARSSDGDLIGQADATGLFERDARTSPLDARFWQQGWRVRGQREDDLGEAIPAFLAPLALELLDGSKSVGLLRALGSDVGVSLQPCEDLLTVLGVRTGAAADGEPLGGEEDDNDDDAANSVEAGEEPITPVESIAIRRLGQAESAAIVSAALFKGARAAGSSNIAGAGPAARLETFHRQSSTVREAGTRDGDDGEALARALLKPHLGKTLSQHLQPMLTLVRRRLHAALVSSWYEDGCDLFAHLAAIQGFYLMLRGVEMSEWCDLVFDRLDAGGRLDAHFLDASFRDAIGSGSLDGADGANAWIDSGSVRFQVRDTATLRRLGASPQSHGVGLLAGIGVAYQVPWPASFCFTPAAMSAYQDVFTLLLQVQRARKSMAGLLKASHKHQRVPSLRRFWGLRRRIDWLVRVVGEYLIRDVIESSASQLRASMDELITFDSLIECHGRAMERVRYLCFLQPGQATVRGSILEALDLAIDVSRAYATTFDEDAARPDEVRQRDRERAQRRRKARRANGKARRGRAGDVSDDEDDEDEAGAGAEEAKGGDAGSRGGAAAGVAGGRHGGDQSSSSLSSSTLEDTSQSWIDDDVDVGTQRRSFGRRVDSFGETLRQVLVRIKAGVDEQVGRLAFDVAARSREGTTADEAIRAMHEERERFQALLYALDEGR
ncbi:uncharacterized protein PFL1_05548 [Pseudozyma flocculosa PF-1]|uniref:Spindle pole body component n=2 Tax=Pseudozyma flocculosa TaxID=84751 RepID=A0A5C3FCJ7_9BASI|nr:uncharacterized protein PFL1_05548 [Pseudozyma flocculosa PF-1]EPQ26913.1 hypothetical protein PFL1_05548 [Pseudozyma flocculosa PF-1]SPO41181.1 uncharacterized protein PSFLO_06663 [Pseudozyma flocculosa]